MVTGKVRVEACALRNMVPEYILVKFDGSIGPSLVNI